MYVPPTNMDSGGNGVGEPVGEWGGLSGGGCSWMVGRLAL